MAKVGILTFSDGRRYAHEPQIEENRRFEARLRAVLEQQGRFPVFLMNVPRTWETGAARASDPQAGAPGDETHSRRRGQRHRVERVADGAAHQGRDP